MARQKSLVCAVLHGPIMLQCMSLVLADIVEKLCNCEATGIADPFETMRLRCCEAFVHLRGDQLGELAKVLGGSCE
jgi:hypothetical protein